MQQCSKLRLLKFYCFDPQAVKVEIRQSEPSKACGKISSLAPSAEANQSFYFPAQKLLIAFVTLITFLQVTEGRSYHGGVEKMLGTL